MIQQIPPQKTHRQLTSPDLILAGDDPAKKSICSIIYAFIQVARQNEAGIIEDTDTEFLHDYRVSLRKVRSVLSLFKGVFDSPTETRMKKAFGTIMKKTNLLRDRDVYLLSRQDYLNRLSSEHHDGLEILFSLLEKERHIAFKEVSLLLSDRAYQEQIKGLTRLFASQDELPAGPKAETSFRDLACFLILKRYKKVCKIARKVSNDTPDGKIHDLRIQCKKLRYLIEATSPLFDTQKGKQLIKKLKKIQKHLGRFNDLSVQQAALVQCLERDTSKDEKRNLLARSIAALNAMLYQEQRDERQRILQTLAPFYSPGTLAAFEQLYT